jgi:hypothetical protein
MAIRFACRNGHRLKAEVRHAGRKMKCPRCRVTVWVPQPARLDARQEQGVLTDTQAVRLLGSYHPSQKNLLSAPSPTPVADERQCPKCGQLVPSLCRICPSCNTYMGTTP